MPRVIAHIDMDCFFCACEVKRNPLLRGRPLIVGATSKRGVVCTASYEARRYGVHSALPISIARQRCPQGIYLPVDGRRYREESKAVMRLFARIADDMERVSIDEAYLDLTTFSEQFSSLIRMGSYIQKLVQKTTELSCSIGIAHDRTVAKIASDFKKPAGITVVQDPKAFLSPLPIEKIPGIGKQAKQYYHNSRVHTIGDLIMLDRFSVLDRFGMQGVRYQQIATGEIMRGVTHRAQAKSVSREQTFIEDREPNDVRPAIMQLCDRVRTDLPPYYFKTVSIKVRYSDFSTKTRDFTLTTATDASNVIREKALRLFERLVEGDQEERIRLVGIRLTGLVEGCGRQQQLLAYA